MTKYKKIKLTKGKVALVDNVDYERLNLHKWSYNGSYAIRSNDDKTWYMHWEVMGKPKKDLEIDHINGNKLDNRKENLRVATRQQNSYNKGKHKDAMSIYKGVSCDKKSKRIKRWTARIMIDGKYKNLGYFLTEKEATQQYNKIAKKCHGEFVSI